MAFLQGLILLAIQYWINVELSHRRAMFHSNPNMCGVKYHLLSLYFFLHCASFELLSHLWDFSNFQYLLLIGHSRPDRFKVFYIRVKMNVHIPNKSNALVQFSACSTVPMCLPVRTANSCLYCHQTYHLYLCSFLEF